MGLKCGEDSKSLQKSNYLLIKDLNGHEQSHAQKQNTVPVIVKNLSEKTTAPVWKIVKVV